MTIKKRALITGAAGQDGSYLCELLLEKDYEVHGLVKYSTAGSRMDNIRHLLGDVKIVEGDLLDAAQIARTLSTIKPHEVYNLASQSHVGLSFEAPVYTANVTGMSVLYLLEGIRQSGFNSKFYQASTSEMFGNAPGPQDEDTPFSPRSPYGCAKLFAHSIAKNYRESYNMFVCSGILFNHECIGEKTPIIVRREGIVEVLSASDLIPLRRKGKNTQTFTPDNVEIWDGESWTQIKAITATKRDRKNKDHNVLWIEGRAGVVNCTSHHTMIKSDKSEIRADNLKTGDELLLGNLPSLPSITSITEEMAEFLGLMAAEGYVALESNKIQFTNQDKNLLEKVENLWHMLFLGKVRASDYLSGFQNGNNVTQLHLNGCSSIASWLREQLYCKSGFKHVPTIILNASDKIQAAFLSGYYAGDGLKAGNGESIKTNSPMLAQGLNLLYSQQGKKSSVYVEHRGNKAYYQINLQSVSNTKGKHLKKNPNEIRKINSDVAPDEWVFDLETESSVFMAGVGRVIVHNSPRRGENFVTRKITKQAAEIKLGLRTHIELGNLDAKRDWGHAKDYVQGMHMMMQHSQPDDYVLSTGTSYSVREFLEEVFQYLFNEPYDNYVKTNPLFLRPAEINNLVGNSAKARSILGWQPEYNFKALVKDMVTADLEKIQKNVPR